MADLPIVVTAAGVQPRTPADILASLLAAVSGIRPGYTANLPGILVEDISSTDTYAIIECDSARVDAINSLTPEGANAFLLLQLGQMLGIPQGGASLNSVLVVFTGTPNFVIGAGFLISDGTFQYQLVDGGIVDSTGVTSPLYAVSTLAGSWAIPAGTVTQIQSSIPDGIVLSVVNPAPGIPGTGVESEASYRSRVLQANYAASQGMSSFLRTLLGKVRNVQPRLIKPLKTSDGWEIIVGGGDPAEVAYAIYRALFNISNIVPSTLSVAAATSASPCLVTTFLNHLFSAGQVITIADTTPSLYSGTFTILTVPTEKTFTLGTPFAQNSITAGSWTGGTITLTMASPHGVTVGSTFVISGCSVAGYNGTAVAIAGTTGSTLKYTKADPGANATDGTLQPGVAFYDTTASPYVSGGVITPNFRNVTQSIIDWPDTYQLQYVSPPQQTVTMTVSWHTTSPNFVSSVAVAQAAAPAIADYINTIPVGDPINVLQLEDAFQLAITNILPTSLISTLTFAVSINGVGTAPDVGTGLIEGDPESYFFAVASGISVVEI